MMKVSQTMSDKIKTMMRINWWWYDDKNNDHINGLTKKGKATGNHRFSHEIWDFPVILPLKQSIDHNLPCLIPTSIGGTHSTTLTLPGWQWSGAGWGSHGGIYHCSFVVALESIQKHDPYIWNIHMYIYMNVWNNWNICNLGKLSRPHCSPSLETLPVYGLNSG